MGQVRLLHFGGFDIEKAEIGILATFLFHPLFKAAIPYLVEGFRATIVSDENVAIGRRLGARPDRRDRYPTGGPGFGFEHFKQYDFLRDKEVVLTFDDGPWPGNTPAVLKAPDR